MISAEDTIRVKKLISTFKERPLQKRMVLYPFVQAELLATKSGILVPNEAAKKAFNTQGDHGKPQLDRMYDSEFAVVVTTSETCDQKTKPGDIIRFAPLSAYKIYHEELKLALINELDAQTVISNIYDDEIQVKKKPVKKK